jgi:hypothetical protein
MIGQGVALGGVLLLALGCSKKQEAPRRTEPWLASASASASSAPTPREAFDFRFKLESSIRFSLTGHKAKLGGQVPLRQGKLRLDPGDLTKTTASIDADLTGIALTADASASEPLPEGGGLPASPSARALDWLELGPAVAAERRAQFAIARFELVSLENLSATFLDHAKLRDGERSAVRATAIGTLLLHGYRAPVRVQVRLQALPPTAASPFRLSIRSTSPLVLPLAPHDIVARGPSGRPDPLQTERAAGFVGKSARIEFELVAEVASR